jgi:hypothetical protein
MSHVPDIARWHLHSRGLYSCLCSALGIGRALRALAWPLQAFGLGPSQHESSGGHSQKHDADGGRTSKTTELAPDQAAESKTERLLHHVAPHDEHRPSIHGRARNRPPHTTNFLSRAFKHAALLAQTWMGYVLRASRAPRDTLCLATHGLDCGMGRRHPSR